MVALVWDQSLEIYDRLQPPVGLESHPRPLGWRGSFLEWCTNGIVACTGRNRHPAAGSTASGYPGSNPGHSIFYD